MGAKAPPKYSEASASVAYQDALNIVKSESDDVRSIIKGLTPLGGGLTPTHTAMIAVLKAQTTVLDAVAERILARLKKVGNT